MENGIPNRSAGMLSPESVPAEVLPACSVCGKQDETLRSVMYPFVISVVLLTFKRVFSGTWCEKHQWGKLLTAGLISSSIGWLGIPFGLVATPPALWKLTRGGTQPKLANQENLRILGDLHLRQGDSEIALRCYQECLKFGEDELAASQIGQIISHRPEQGQPGKGHQFRIIITLLLGSVGMGLLIGVLNFGFETLSAPLQGLASSLFGVILSWMPMIVSGYLGSIFLYQMVQKSLSQGQILKTGASYLLGMLSGALAAAGILQGEAAANYLRYYFELFPPGSFSIGLNIQNILKIIFTGGYYALESMLEFQSLSQILYFALLLTFLVYYMITAGSAAAAISRWRDRISQIPG